MVTKIFNAVKQPTELEKNEITNFLYTHLDQYGDPKSSIRKAMDYSVKAMASFGGFTIVIKDHSTIKGAAIVNNTGMGGYIPENLLVYVAIDKASRGQGLGKGLMEKVITYTQGDIALHVDANNPAKQFYEQFGFTNPYLEMRLKK